MCCFFCFVYCSREKLNQARCLFLPWMCGERHHVAATSSSDLDAAVRSAEGGASVRDRLLGKLGEILDSIHQEYRKRLECPNTFVLALCRLRNPILTAHTVLSGQ